MSSTLFKTVFAGVVTAGAFLIPATAAQAAVSHHPCDGPGFGHGAFFGDSVGFDDDFDDDFGFDDDDDFGFRNHRRHDTIIIVTVDKTTKATKKHHKPAATSAGYAKPTKNGDKGDDGYHKGA